MIFTPILTFRLRCYIIFKAKVDLVHAKWIKVVKIRVKFDINIVIFNLNFVYNIEQNLF